MTDKRDGKNLWGSGPKVTELRRRASDRLPPRRAVLATLGRDRPGLVTALTALIEELGLSIEDSRMTVLGGEFATLLSVAGSNERLNQLEGAFARFCDEHALASLFRISNEKPVTPALPYRVSVLALDHPGIVRSVANFFSERAINIINLDTELTRAPHTGTAMFDLLMTVAIPEDTPIAELAGAFNAFCADANLDGELTIDR
ncbi:MAG: ACT domain-containing protein [Pseudomonadota bacterium]